ncbi:hypothetical protein [Streptomyces sp. NPDC050264]|uniref:hypothetical protein n=1 Tax=Streptomyces sp. NPDC050264 TaxID=3155038 RepID=UPI0034213BD5
MSEQHSKSSALSGLPLVLIVLGALALILATFMPPAIGGHGWRWVVVGGSVVQFVGWVLLGWRLARQGGGAR